MYVPPYLNTICFGLVFVETRVSLSSPGWLGAHSVDQAGLEPIDIHLFPLPKCHSAWPQLIKTKECWDLYACWASALQKVNTLPPLLGNFTAEYESWRNHLTKECKLSKMLLEKFDHSKTDLSIATKESLSTECPFSFQGPHIYLFLTISECTVARISTLILCSNIWKGRRVRDTCSRANKWQAQLQHQYEHPL